MKKRPPQKVSNISKRRSTIEEVAETLDELSHPPWFWLVMEGEVEGHENCQGPDCECNNGVEL